MFNSLPFNISNIVNKNHHLNQGLVSWWLTIPEIAGGSKFYDIFGPNHGTLTNSPTWQGSTRPGSFGAPAFVGGATNLIDCGTFSVVSSTATFCLWVKFNALNSSRDDRLLSKASGTAANQHDWMLGKTDSSGHKFRMRCNRTNTTLVGTTIISTGVWYHVVGTFSNGAIVLYVNGVSNGGTGVNAGNLPDNTDSVYIGNQPTSTTNSPDAQIDSVRIYNRVLSVAEIKELIDEESTGYQNTLNRLNIIVPTVEGGGTTVVGQNSQFLWNLNKIIGGNPQLLWNILSSIGNNNQFLWNTLVGAEQGSDLRWNILQTASQSNQFLWNLAQIIGNNPQLLWNILNVANKDSDLRWNVTETTSQNNQFLWNVNQTTGQNNQFLWNLAQIVGNNPQLLWNILQTVEQNNQFLWNVYFADNIIMKLIHHYKQMGIM